MKRVQLIVTGEMEMCALHSSLRRLFPVAEFLAPFRADSFTSSRLIDAPAAPMPSRGLPTKPVVNKLAKALISFVEPGRQQAGQLDLVLVVDDLELVNQDQPGVVIARFARAIREELQARNFVGDTQRKVEQKLRERCSFHLFSPMAEAYFFGETSALVRAEARRKSHFDAMATDVEQFRVDDPDYLGVADGHRPWARTQRASHPKHYLGFLCTPMDDSLSAKSESQHYRETKQGKAALECLDWSMILSPPKHARFARSMIQDVSDALDVESSIRGECARETERRDRGLLRNL